MDYIIGVDGGGTKTEAVAYDIDGNDIKSAIKGMGNVLLGFEKALSNIESSINGCMEGIDGKCMCICLGLSGIEAGNNLEKLKGILSDKYKVPIKIVNDAEIAHISMLKGKDGILTISGTGSISYGTYNGVKKRIGGWGHILGDEGSGYYIALQALKKIIYDYDNENEETMLAKEVLKKINAENTNDIKVFVYSSDKSNIASLVPVVVKCADNGDEASIDILKDAGISLAKDTLRLNHKLGVSGVLRVAIKGSILTNISIVRNEFERYIRERIENVDIINEKEPPVKGGYYMGINLI